MTGGDNGLTLKEDTLCYNSYSVGEVSSMFAMPGFTMPIEEISVVAISPRLSFDDEVLIVTLINKEGQFVRFCNRELKKTAVAHLEKRLGIESILYSE